MMKHSKDGISIQNTNLVMTVAAIIISVLLIWATFVAGSQYSELQTRTDQYIQWQKDASALQAGSDYLTKHARCLAENGERVNVDNYF